MIIKTIDGADFEFTPKRLKLRSFRDLMVCLETIQESTRKASTFEQIENGMRICLDDYDPETNELDFAASMEVIAETIRANRVSVDERKKSE